jgi:hypothetical protein
MLLNWWRALGVEAFGGAFDRGTITSERGADRRLEWIEGSCLRLTRAWRKTSATERHVGEEAICGCYFLGDAQPLHHITSPSLSDASRWKSTWVSPSVSRARNHSSGVFVLLNPDDNQGGPPCIPFLSGSRQFYFFTTIIGKHGTKPKGVCCRCGTPSRGNGRRGEALARGLTSALGLKVTGPRRRP